MKSLYKYKSLSGKGLKYFLDIVEDSQIYFPEKSILNDPFECYGLPKIYLLTAGSSFYSCRHQHHGIVQEIMDEYRILSLSSTPDNVLMWAHYADQCSGVCIEFDYSTPFSTAKPVQYKNLDTLEEMTQPGLEVIEELVEQSFYCKNKDWEYENEYRIVKKSKEKYINFEPCKIKSIILGCKIKKEHEEIILKVCREKNIQVYYAVICNLDYKIYIISPEGYRKMTYYDNWDDTMKYIKK